MNLDQTFKVTVGDIIEVFERVELAREESTQVQRALLAANRAVQGSAQGRAMAAVEEFLEQLVQVVD